MFYPASLFGNGAVLCRRKVIRLFGEAEDGKIVKARLLDTDGALLAGGESIAAGGRFLICLPPQEAREGCSLCFECGEEQVISRDILVGDVFLDGGQSNMELPLWDADEGKERIGSHHAPQVRYFHVPKCPVTDEKQKEEGRKAHWQKIVPGSGGDMSAVAYFFAMEAHREKNVPVGMIDCWWGGTSITCWMEESWLRGTREGALYLERYEAQCGGKTLEAYYAEEAAWQKEMDEWNRSVARFREEHPACVWDEVINACGYCPWHPPVGPASPYRPAGLAEPMLKTVAPAALSGILFYQGEADAGQTHHYDTLLEQMILYWRQLFQDEGLPFLNVQLPMWRDEGAEDTFTWPEIRLCQARVRDRIRNTGMICMMDQGEFNNIHPTNKRVVGERLWMEAREVVYGEKTEKAPRIMYICPEGDRIRVVLSAPVTMRGDGELLLEIAGEDEKYVPARAELTENGMILSGVKHPVHARYGHTDYAAVKLFGMNGLPLEPFWQ